MTSSDKRKGTRGAGLSSARMMLSRLGDASTEDLIIGAITSFLVPLFMTTVEEMQRQNLEMVQLNLMIAAASIILLALPVILLKAYRHQKKSSADARMEEVRRRLDQWQKERDVLLELKVKSHERQMRLLEKVVEGKLAMMAVQVNAIRRKAEFFWLQQSRDIAMRYVEAVNKQVEKAASKEGNDDDPPSSKFDEELLSRLSFDDRDEIDVQSEKFDVAMAKIVDKVDEVVEFISEADAFKVDEIEEFHDEGMESSRVKFREVKEGNGEVVATPESPMLLIDDKDSFIEITDPVTGEKKRIPRVTRERLVTSDGDEDR